MFVEWLIGFASQIETMQVWSPPYQFRAMIHDMIRPRLLGSRDTRGVRPANMLNSPSGNRVRSTDIVLLLLTESGTYKRAAIQRRRQASFVRARRRLTATAVCPGPRISPRNCAPEC